MPWFTEAQEASKVGQSQHLLYTAYIKLKRAEYILMHLILTRFQRAIKLLSKRLDEMAAAENLHLRVTTPFYFP